MTYENNLNNIATELMNGYNSKCNGVSEEYISPSSCLKLAETVIDIKVKEIDAIMLYAIGCVVGTNNIDYGRVKDLTIIYLQNNGLIPPTCDHSHTFPWGLNNYLKMNK